MNFRIFGFKSLRGFYRWRKTVRENLFHAKGMPLGQRLWAVRNGFSAEIVKLYGIEELKAHKKDYLSTKEYYKLHPLNNVYTFWIDDKLTTKYVFSKFNEYLPKYYFHIEGSEIQRCGDCKKPYPTTPEGMLECLDDCGLLALKRIVGSYGAGFYRVEKKDGGYTVNGKTASRAEVLKLFAGLRNYLVMECIQNHRVLRKVWPNALNTMRVLISNINGEITVLGAFIRFGTKESGGVDNAAAGGFEVTIDENTGHTQWGFTKHSDILRENIMAHPDSGVSVDFQIPYWDEIISKLKEITAEYPQLRFLGYDIAVEDDSFKIIEINSLSGLVALQAKHPFCADPKTRKVFEQFGLKRKHKTADGGKKFV